MSKRTSLWNSVGLLAGLVILIIALAKGTLRTVLLSAVAAAWMIWLAVLLIRRHRRPAHRREKAYITPEQLLLRHVNHRISARLCAVYPDASWKWCVRNPVRFICKGGTGRIRVYGVDDYDYADVRIDRQANLACELIKTVPLNKEDTENDSKLPPNRQPVDPRVWYETQGRAVLERVVADLNSRGHSRLTLAENGDICIKEDKKNVAVEHFSAFPEKVCWPGLVHVLQGDGLAADATAQGVEITW